MDNNRTTRMGTPWAHTWDYEWARCVQRKEDELGHRICGAKTLAGNPCTLTSNHKTGRCAFHGGTDAIGAPVGNSNARIHGLYARRLQRCGTHCPMWQHCPFAGAEILKLDPPERPNCAYETAEYEAVLQELDAGEDEGPHPPLGFHRGSDQGESTSVLAGIAHGRWPSRSSAHPKAPQRQSHLHHLALLQVMVSRAAAALSVTPLTDDVNSDSERYHMHTTKVHAALEAFIRLTREHRATLAQYHRDQIQARSELAETTRNGHVPSLADLATPILARADGVLEEAIAAENERREYTRRLEAMLTERVGPEWKSDPAFLDSG